MKEKLKLDRIKEFLGKYSRKTKIAVGAGIIVVIAAAVIIALVLNHKDYTVLFSGLTEEEATQITGKLQEAGTAFQYKGDGVIMVPEEAADQTRANLAYEGYPKSGFSYDVFTEHAGGMTTDAEKQTYKLYDLQNRIGATVRLFDGVKDAKVNIALPEEKKYALTDKGEEGSGSASVVVTMEDGGSPTEKQAAGIQRLVARSVADMPLENVSVFDGNGIEVSVDKGGSSTSGDTGEEIAQLIENQIAKKVINVLEPFYGTNNIRVSARGKVNMEKVIRETTTYNTPEKIDEEDKTGIVSGEEIDRESAGGGTLPGGVAGSEANADVTQYNAGTEDGEGSYASESIARDYLVNQIKEQGELDPGVLEDLTVSVSINGENLGDLTNNEIRDLVGNATGIVADDRADKITIANAPFFEEEEPARETAGLLEQLTSNLPVVIVAAVLALIVIILIVALVKRSRKKRLLEDEELLEDFAVPVDMDGLDLERQKPELLNLKNEKSRELRESVRDFAEQNPEISAQMIKNWLNGGGQDA